MNLLTEFRSRSSPRQRSLSWPLGWPIETVTMGGTTYPLGTSTSPISFQQEDIPPSYASFAQLAMLANPIVWSCMEYRRKTFSQAVFQWQRLRGGTTGPAGEFFGTADLGILEQPWTNATTPDLLNRVIQDGDLAGNAFIVRRGRKLRVLRPDWVSIIAASMSDPELGSVAIDAEVMGYAYWPGGKGRADPVILLPEEVAHFAPTPDPMATFRGVSWLHAPIRDILGDQAATTHKLKYFENGGSGAYVVKFDPNVVNTLEKFDAWVAKLEANHKGAMNAYRTWYLAAATDVTTVGANLRQEDFKVTTGAGETRIAAAAGVHPVLLPFSEGLQGSALNAGNYDSAKRSYIDATLWDLWGNISGALQSILPTPPGARLWVDGRHISLLKEAEKDRAEIQQLDATAISTLVTAGYEPESVINAVTSGDLSRLVHSGLYSVQLQAPGTQTPAPPEPPAEPVPPQQQQVNSARQALIERGIARPSQEQIAEELGVSSRTVRRWEGA